MLGKTSGENYDGIWGQEKLGKLYLSARDYLENGKRPLLPAETFYSDWRGTLDDLAGMCKKILKYMNYEPQKTLRVYFSKKIENPGMFESDGSDLKITVSKQYQFNASACAAILAHEITHLILNERKCREEVVLENEKFTDFATVYFGLGVLVLNGKYSDTGDFKSLPYLRILGAICIIIGIIGLMSGSENISLVLFFTIVGGILLFGNLKPNTVNTEYTFGYWEKDQYYTIFTGYLLRNNLNWDHISKYIKKGTKYSGLSD